MAETSDRLSDWSTALPWRRSELRRHGFDPDLAALIAADLRYSLRDLLDLVARGCPPELAARILAPLDAHDA
jgi:hypothetical protein